MKNYFGGIGLCCILQACRPFFQPSPVFPTRSEDRIMWPPLLTSMSKFQMANMRYSTSNWMTFLKNIVTSSQHRLRRGGGGAGGGGRAVVVNWSSRWGEEKETWGKCSNLSHLKSYLIYLICKAKSTRKLVTGRRKNPTKQNKTTTTKTILGESEATVKWWFVASDTRQYMLKRIGGNEVNRTRKAEMKKRGVHVNRWNTHS